MILNEFDEVIVSQRKEPGTLFHDCWAFPGGYQEYGESWAQTSYREVLEECALELDEQQIKVLEIMDIQFLEANYHNVGVFTFIQVKKDKTHFSTTEPHKNSDWRWVAWKDFIKKKPLFIPFKYFF